MDGASDFAEQLRARLAQPLPGRIAQRQMEPQLSFGRHAGPAPDGARAAAVLALLFPDDPTLAGWSLPLTRRPAHLVAHARQVSLPGGAVEAGESSSAAAVRELQEELGIDPVDVEVVGALTPLYVFGTNFLVTPWVALSRGRPAWRPSPDEVDELLEVSLAELADPDVRRSSLHRRGPLQFRAPHFEVASHHVWGATAMILSELLQVLRDVNEPPSDA